MEIKVKNDGLLNGRFLTKAEEHQIDIDVPKMSFAGASCCNCAFYEHDGFYCRAFSFTMEYPEFLKCAEHTLAKNTAEKEIQEIVETLTEKTLEAMEDF